MPSKRSFVIALAAISVACIGSDPESASASAPNVPGADGGALDTGGGANPDGSTSLGRCVFGTSRFGDDCKLGL